MERETYRGAIGDVDNAKVRSAVGLCWRPCLSNGGGRCQCGYLGALPRPLHVPYDYDLRTLRVTHLGVSHVLGQSVRTDCLQSL
jgi:hypothetical protein